MGPTSNLLNHHMIIPTPHHYTYFAQFDWLEKKFYTSINSMSMELETIVLPPAPKMLKNIDKNMILMTKLEYKGMNYYFLCVCVWILSMF